MSRWVVHLVAALVVAACSESTVVQRATSDGHGDGGPTGDGGSNGRAGNGSGDGGSGGARNRSNGGSGNVANGGSGNGANGGSGNGADGGSGNGGSGNAGSGGTTQDGHAAWCGVAGGSESRSTAGSCAVDRCDGAGAGPPPATPPEGDVTIDYGASGIKVLLSARAAGSAIVFTSGTTPVHRIQTFPPETSANAPVDYFTIGDEITISSDAFSGVLAVPAAPALRLGGELFPDGDAGAGASVDAGSGAPRVPDLLRCAWIPFATGEIEVQLTTVFAPDLNHNVHSFDCSFPASAGGGSVPDVRYLPTFATMLSGATYSVVRTNAEPASSGITLVARRRLLTF